MPTRSKQNSPHGRRWRRGLAVLIGLVAIIAGIVYWSAGFFDRDPVRLYGLKRGAKPPLAAVFVSGDMGVRYGLGAYVVAALADAGIPVYAIASSAAFVHHRDRAEVDAMLAQAIRAVMWRTGAGKVVVIGQSFGADIARVGMTALPAKLRPHVVALVLVVPGAGAYFRADPLNIAYLGRPDADAADARALTWLPVMCISGEAERDSLCPYLIAGNIRRITLPGDHYLRMDHDLLVRTLFTALAPMRGAHPEMPRR